MKKIFVVFIAGIFLILGSFNVGCSQSPEPAAGGDQTSASGGNGESGETSPPDNGFSDDENSLCYYTVRFYDGDKLIESQKIEKGNTFFKPQDLTDEFEEYEFIGWVKDGESEIYDFSAVGATIVSENITFRAQWIKIEYTPWVK